MSRKGRKGKGIEGGDEKHDDDGKGGVKCSQAMVEGLVVGGLGQQIKRRPRSL
jgi:hypothetical protein